MNVKKYTNNTWREITPYKYSTSVETYTDLPQIIYANGNSASIGLKGALSQSGVPSPTNPIQPQGCGDLETTGVHAGQYKIPISSGSTTTPVYLGSTQTVRQVKKLVLTGQENLDINNSCFVLWFNSVSYPNPKQELIYCTHYEGRTPTYRGSLANGQCMITINQNQIAIKDLTYATVEDFKSYLAAQYAAGTPVTVWYVLATPETAVVNEPIRKIGTYADEVSGITIPVTAGENTLSIGTTLQPSEVTVNYKGWHPVSAVHERDNGAWT